MANATNFIKSPHPSTFSKGPIQSGATQLFGETGATDVWLNLAFNGVPQPTQGAGWAGKGSTGFDSTTGIWYANIGTAAVPNWQKIGAQ